MEIRPGKKEFLKLARSKNLIIFSTKFYADWLTPLSIYARLRKTLPGENLLLESVEGEEKISRFSFLAFKPLRTFLSRGREITVKEGTRSRKFITEQDPLAELRGLLDTYRAGPMEHLRFFGGFIGYVGYDTVRFYEPAGNTPKPDPLGTPDVYCILPKYLVIFDHPARQVEILSFLPLDSRSRLSSCYSREIESLQRVSRTLRTPGTLYPLEFRQTSLRTRSNFQTKDFLAAVRRAKKLIKEGEIIQAVLSQRLTAEFHGDPFLVYRYLRILNPSPYMFYLHFNDLQVCGSSPEMLLRCEQGELITRPIAGTRKRGTDETEDARQEQSLLNDPKEIAEHIMLVDLARNDLGRVAKKASVNLPLFMTVERFSHVMHIVSEVRARLNASQEDIFSALISCFPAGTVSGAPKVRAMQIIDDLEPERRGIYAGCVGYFSLTGSLDTCIIIRTIVFAGGKAYVQAGAGIVNDSVPEREYQETLSKARAQLVALEYAAAGNAGKRRRK
ncbi:MAG: anthranilate synthase component I [Candidatus Omnitrophica bacterium]|nr:anthranilate synthase component I [Candidatus Omnitrophota bacterium]